MKNFKSLSLLLVLFFSVVLLVGCIEQQDKMPTTTTPTQTETEPIEPEPDFVNPPTGVKVTDGFVTWHPITDADYYLITIADQSYQVNRPRFNLNELDLDGDYTVQIQVVVDGMQSKPYVLNYHFIRFNQRKQTIYSDYLEFIGIEDGLTRDDFPSDEAYDDYLQLISQVNALVVHLAKVNLSVAELETAVQLIETLANRLSEGDVETALSIFEELISIPHFSYRFAYLATHYLELFLEDSIRQIAKQYPTDPVYSDDEYWELVAIREHYEKTDARFRTFLYEYYQKYYGFNDFIYIFYNYEDQPHIYQKWEDFVDLLKTLEKRQMHRLENPPEDFDPWILDVLDHFCLFLLSENKLTVVENSQYDLTVIYPLLQDYAVNVSGNPDDFFELYYSDDFNKRAREYFDHSLYHEARLYYDQYLSNDGDYTDGFLPLSNMFLIYLRGTIDDIERLNEFKRNYDEAVAKWQDVRADYYDQSERKAAYFSHLSYVRLLSAIRENREDFLDGIETIVDSLTAYYQAINGLSFIHDQEELDLSPELLKMMKDEIVAMLETNLPTIDQYESGYFLLYTFAGVLGDERYPEEINAVVQASAKTSYYANRLFIEWLRKIELETIEGIMTQIAWIATSESFNEEVLDAIIDLWLHLDGLIRRTIEGHPDLMEGISTILADDIARQQFYAIIESIMIRTVRQSDDMVIEGIPNQTIIAMIRHWFHHMDRLEQLMKFGWERGKTAYDLLVESNGQLIKDYYRFIQSTFIGEIDPASVLAIYYELFNYMQEMALTDDEVEALVTDIFDLMVLPMLEYGYPDFSNEQKQLIQKTVLPFIVRVAKLTNQAHLAMGTYLHQNDEIVKLLENEHWKLEERYAIAFLWALDDWLGTNRQTLTNLVHELFDDVLSHSVLMDLLELTPDEVTQVKQETLEGMHALFDEIQTVSQFDIDKLTPEEEERLQHMMALIFELFMGE